MEMINDNEVDYEIENQIVIIDSLVKAYDGIREAADAIDAYLSSKDEVYMETVSHLKSIAQKEAREAFANAEYRGFINGATGTGKSKIAIDEIVEMAKENIHDKALIVVPTQKLRDENWKDEFKKWKKGRVWSRNVERACYVSINKLKGKHYKYVVLDEGHNITESNSQFFANNTVERVLLLSATAPRDKEKKEILKRLNIHEVYHMPLDTAVKLRLVSPYEVVVVEVKLDNTDKYIKAGSKEKPFFTTEEGQYNYMTRQVNQLMFSNVKTLNTQKALKFKLLNRMRFIYGLKTKTEATKWILDQISEQERLLIFCGSISQAEELCENTFHSKTDDKALTRFKRSRTNRISCVNGLNEGHNINNVDREVIAQLSSNDKDFIQRAGRILRYKPGHIGQIIIICCIDTVDEKWTKTALESIDQSKIRRVRFENLVNGTDKL